MFPGATADREQASYVIVGAPLDISTTFQPGTRFGPDRIRRFARTFDDYDRRSELHFSDLGVHDSGDIHAWTDAAEYLTFLTGTLTDVLDDGAVPIVLGGEHTVSIAGVRATTPSTYVCLDAHLDLRESYDGDPWSHATVTHHVLETVDRVFLLGARTGSEAEWARADGPAVTVVAPEHVEDWLSNLGDALPTTGVYLSIDIDVADPAIAPGTGTMEPFGLDSRLLRDIVRAVAPRTVGFDVVEVNDRDHGQSGALAGKLVREFVYSKEHGPTDI